MVVNRFWGTFLLGFVINLISGCLAYNITKFSDKLLKYVSKYKKIIVFISCFVLIDYFAVTKLFVHKEMIVESVLFSLGVMIGIIVSFISASFLKSIASMVVQLIIWFLITTLLWTGLCYQKSYEKYKANISETPVITEERYELAD